MAESQAQKKNKKTKKKLETNAPPSIIPTNEDEKNSNATLSNDSIKQNLCKDANVKTSGNAEVAVTPDTKPENESSNKKKKKSKKKSKEVLKETFLENKPESLLNFSENGIQLVNHPEISVTITDPSQSKDDETKGITDNIPPFDEEKQASDTVAPSTKKKKKKKKKVSNSIPVETNTSSEPPFSTPTYTKVVTPDNTCVLVVNNENFSVDTKSSDNTETTKNKMPENSIDFSIPSEKQLGNVLLTKNFTPDTNVKFNNSVSIFPVLTNENSDAKPQTVLNVNHNLETVSTSLKTEISEPTTKENIEESKPTKAQLKAERRAKQEAQRAAKVTKNNTKLDANSSNAVENKSNTTKEKNIPKEAGSNVSEPAIAKASAKLPVEKEALHKVKLFSHLPQYKPFDIIAKIHPAVLETGLQYSEGIICGSNARCVALLEALKEIINDYTLQPDKIISRDLESDIQTNLNFLNNCRPLSVSMISAIKFLKHKINRMPSDMEVDQIKENLCHDINNFVNENILLAKETICNCASYKIVDGDVILVFAHSSLVRDVLCRAHDKNKIFRVVVVDSRPKLEGLKMLRSLVKQGLHCSYISINALSYVMKDVTKVILGAHALLSNGCVISRLGNKQVALVASSYHIPVFVCCETYKFCERVLTDSFVHNELGKPEDIITASLVPNESLKNWRDLPSLQPLNLLYDITSPDLMYEIITEKGALPCTSVPVVLRVKYAVLNE